MWPAHEGRLSETDNVGWTLSHIGCRLQSAVGSLVGGTFQHNRPSGSPHSQGNAIKKLNLPRNLPRKRQNKISFLFFFYGYSFILMRFRSGFRHAFGAGSWPAKFSREIANVSSVSTNLED